MHESGSKYISFPDIALPWDILGCPACACKVKKMWTGRMLGKRRGRISSATGRGGRIGRKNAVASQRMKLRNSVPCMGLVGKTEPGVRKEIGSATSGMADASQLRMRPHG